MASDCCRGVVIFFYLTALTLELLCGGWLPQLILVSENEQHGRQTFDHPFVLAWAMFVGQFLCLGVFFLLRCYHRIRGSYFVAASKMNPLSFCVASILQMASLSATYIGLTLYGSFLLYSGIGIILTGMLSVFFLGRYIRCHMWVGQVLEFGGLVCFGVVDLHFPVVQDSSDKDAVVAGAMVIVIAEAIIAGQHVFEEKVITQHNVHPLLAVGLEGFFGTIITSVLLAVFYHIRVPPPFSSDLESRLSNAHRAFTELRDNSQTLVVFISLVVATGLTNACGMTILRDLSAVTRMVLGSLCGPIAWLIINIYHPQEPHAYILPGVGVGVLVIALCIYANVICAPIARKYGWLKPEPTRPSPDQFIPRPRPELVARTRDQDLNDSLPNLCADEREPLLGRR